MEVTLGLLGLRFNWSGGYASTGQYLECEYVHEEVQHGKFSDRRLRSCIVS